MRAGEREWSQVVVEGAAPAKRGQAVALLAGRTESCCAMHGVRSRAVRFAVTSVTVNGDIDIFLFLLVDMTGLARERLMGADEWESRASMPLRHVRDQPGLRSVATVARVAEFIAMDILMTVGTLIQCAVILHRLMTLAAGDLGMLPPELKAGA